MRQQLLAVAGIVGLIGAAASGTASAGDRPSAAVAHRAATDVPSFFSGLDHSSGRASAPKAAGETMGASAATIPYSYNKVTLPDSPGIDDVQVGGINKHGLLTGIATKDVDNKGVDELFLDQKDADTKPTFYQFPYPHASVNAATAGIDSAGDIVGYYFNAAGVYHGFERGHRGVFRELTIPGAGTVKGEGTEINGISPGGVIVGSYVPPDGNAIGFIDNHGHLSYYSEPQAGTAKGQGTAVEFDYDGEYGGVLVKAGTTPGSTEDIGWYIRGGHLHTVEYPAAGSAAKGVGTQLVGVDDTGRLYGIESPTGKPTESFSYVSGGTFSPIVDPHQIAPSQPPLTGTVLGGVTIYGVGAGTYSTDARGKSSGFFALPEKS